MKMMVISTVEDTAVRYALAKNSGYITFIYNHADPCKKLASNKFMYVSSDEELNEKLKLLRADVTVVDQVMRF